MNNWPIDHPFLTILIIFGLAIVCTIIDIKYMQPKDSTDPR